MATDSESNQAGPPIVEVGATDSTLQDAASTIALLVGATDSESGLASPPAVEVGATDSESNQAGPPVVEVGVKEVDGIITLAFVPNLQMRITPHALKILSGVQVIRFKEADSLPNIVFTLIDSQCVQIPLPDNTELYFRASDRETLTEEVYQQLVEIEDSYVLDGATLSPLEPKDYSCEVVVIYNSTLVMTSETFNLDVVKNLNY
ncbi:MAG: hypothetical protein GY928_34065 [Colwellia sp.]|nr:hypothetical protein [Colwellia sp.]